MLRGWCCVSPGRCADPGLVDETAQDSFVRARRHADSCRGDGDVGAWLWGIAVRRLVDRLRKSRPVPVDMSEQATDRTVVAAEERVLSGTEHGDLGAALAQLAPELRAVMQACGLDGLTSREAGELLRIPAGTVKSRMYRARRQLREAPA